MATDPRPEPEPDVLDRGRELESRRDELHRRAADLAAGHQPSQADVVEAKRHADLQRERAIAAAEEAAALHAEAEAFHTGIADALEGLGQSDAAEAERRRAAVEHHAMGVAAARAEEDRHGRGTS